MAGVPPTVATHTVLPGQAMFEELRAEDEEEPRRVGPLQALLGALVAVAGVALVIAAFLVFRGGDQGGTPTVAPPSPSAAVTATPSPTPSAAATPSPTPKASARPSATPTAPATVAAPAPVLPVTVLNNSRIQGLAHTWAARLNAAGWPTPVVGNYSGGVVAQTTVYYAPGQLASAQRLARRFGFPRVLPRFSGLPGHGLTLVLTRQSA